MDTPPRSAPASAAGLPGFGICAAAAGLMLLALSVGERAGLPGTLAWPLAFVLMALAALILLARSRSAEERVFLGRAALLNAWPGGLLLGVISGAACYQMLRPSGSREFVATALGAAFGVLAGHLLARRRGTTVLILGEAGQGEDGAPSLIQGVLMAAAGLMMAAQALPAARDAAMLVTGWGAVASLFLVMLFPLAAVLTGGLRGLLALAAAFALALAASLALTLAIGLAQIGAPPLPGLAPDDTLLAIAGVRTQLFRADTLPFIVSWRPIDGWASAVFSSWFLGAAAVSALLARAVHPALPVGRAPAVAGAIAGQSIVLLGLAAMAGYAVEAAGLQFIGSSLALPPSGLLEASRQGLAEVCGARPATPDELRVACGLAPRAQAQLALGQLALSEAFLWTGVPVAFGYPSALAAPARLGPVIFPALAVTMGLWLAAQGLGRGVFGRGRIAPGLASHRLGLLRLAAIAAVVALVVAMAAGTALPPGASAVTTLLALLTSGLDVIQQGLGRRPADVSDAATSPVQRAAIARRRAAPRNTAQSA